MIFVLAAVLVAYVIVATISGRVLVRRYGSGEITGAERMGLYRHAMLESWCAALLLVVIALVAGIGPARLGLSAPSTALYPIPAVVGVIAMVCGAGMLVVFAWQGIHLVRDPSYRQQAWRQLTDAAGDSSADAVTRLLIPRSPDQRRRYYLVALTAGICEEVVFRGIAFAVLAELFPALPAWTLPIFAAVLFGIPHAYQGAGGIAKTGLVGLVLGYLFAATGFLPACMVVHAVIDLASARLAPDEVGDLDTATR